MKQLLLVALSLIAISTPSFSEIRYDLEDMSQPMPEEGFSPGSLSVGPVGIDGETYFRFGWSPDLQFGPLGLGFDLNLYTGDDVPDDLNSFALRRVAYDHDNWLGFEWGRLRNVTFGQGLLMDGYDSGSFGSSEFNTDKAGVKAYMDLSDVRFDAMYTATEVMAGRVSYRFIETPVLGSDLIVGGTYVKDNNGINETYNGESIIRPEADGWSADVGLPIGGDFLIVYLEHAEIEYDSASAVKGDAVGIRGDFFQAMGYKFEYRNLEAGFIPGYFNSVYEATSTPGNFSEDITGFLAEAYYQFNQFLKAGIAYEAYDEGDPVITGAIGWRDIVNTTGVLNYRQVFTGESDENVGILESDIIFHQDGPFDYIGSYKRIYYPNGEEEDTYSIRLQGSTEGILRSLPFIN